MVDGRWSIDHGLDSNSDYLGVKAWTMAKTDTLDSDSDFPLHYGYQLWPLAILCSQSMDYCLWSMDPLIIQPAIGQHISEMHGLDWDIVLFDITI